MTEPWKHQEEAKALALAHPGFLFGHDMGTGKTFSTIMLLDAIEAKKTLIMGPKVVLGVWPYEFKKHSTVNYNVVAPAKGSVTKRATVVANELQRCDVRGEPIVVVINYESVWREPFGPSYDPKNNNRIIDPGLILKTKWDAAVADEIHRIKAPGSKVSWFAKRLGQKVPKRLGLTGTPFANDLLDIYGQYRFLDPKIYGTSFVRFRNRYAVMGGFQQKKVLGFQNIEEFHKKFYSIAHVVKADDVLDLPDVINEIRRCDLLPKARGIYDEFEKELTVQVGKGELTAQNALTKLLRLGRLTAGYASLDPEDSNNGTVVDNEKIKLTQDILQDLDEPVVIFCRFTNEIQRLHDVCKKLKKKSAELSGHANQLKEWQDGEYDVLLTQIKSGGVGVDMTRARVCFFFSIGYSLADFQQALARIRRAGQAAKKVLYYFIVASNTVDDVIIRSLGKKKKVVDSVIDYLNTT